ncbi:hypothetical protein [Chelativorans sp. AA-79]|uniref:hypothetical protein n=1 Tax=Chelativorans sp. AA-79 TaxID=3028735 RepID=UPI0023F6CBEA|nr:hypothetical protein [Chelativorans sp. AA-79]WEX10338.1 hypothetical protein PVE73_05090 [Chelativorans sp. AA-79]
MNIFDDLPDIGRCPHCGHEGEGLQFGFPDSAVTARGFSEVQAACLACGAHGPARPSYAEAIASFHAGEVEVPA